MNTPAPRVGDRYAVESTDCFQCAACSSLAPANFRMIPGTAEVHRQPESPEQLEACEAARINCPAEAILRTPASRAEAATG